jgi:hypothetical protein
VALCGYVNKSVVVDEDCTTIEWTRELLRIEVYDIPVALLRLRGICAQGTVHVNATAREIHIYQQALRCRLRFGAEINVEQVRKFLVLSTEDGFSGALVPRRGASFAAIDNDSAEASFGCLLFLAKPLLALRHLSKFAAMRTLYLRSIMREKILGELYAESGNHACWVYNESDVLQCIAARARFLELLVRSNASGGKVLLVSVERRMLLPARALGEITVLMDRHKIRRTDSLADVLNPDDDDGRAEYFALLSAEGVQILVSIPHFSEHTITILCTRTAFIASILRALLPFGCYLAGVLLAAVCVLRFSRAKREG